MALNLIIRKVSDPNFHLERKFDQTEISIGRDNTNALILEDRKKILSRNHAQIKYDNGDYYIIDMESRNGTYINNSRLKSNNPYLLDDGSEFTIGDYVIKLSTIKMPLPIEQTIIFNNPFKDDIDSLYHIFKNIEDKYLSTEIESSNDLLKQAFNTINDESLMNEILGLLVDVCAKNGSKIPRTSVEIESDDILDRILDIFLKLIQGMGKFRTEFVCATEIQTKDSLPTHSIDELKKYLFESNLSAEEVKRHHSLFINEIEKVIIHQVAMLDGYRKGIQDGIPEIMKEVNPAVIKKELAKEFFKIGPIRIYYQWIPFLVEVKTLQHVQQHIYTLSVEDRGVFEKKYFRPAFIRRYLENIDMDHRSHPNIK